MVMEYVTTQIWNSQLSFKNFFTRYIDRKIYFNKELNAFYFKETHCEMYGQINIEFFPTKIAVFLIEIWLYKSVSDFIFDCLMSTAMFIKNNWNVLKKL